MIFSLRWMPLLPTISGQSADRFKKHKHLRYIGTAGQVLQGSIQQTLSEHWDGSSWSFVSTPNNNNSNNRLHGITVTPNGTLWAVGTTGVFGQPERTLILRKNP